MNRHKHITHPRLSFPNPHVGKKKKAVHSKKSNLHPLLGATDIREGFLLFLLFNHRWYTCSWSGHVISSHRLSFGATAVQQRGHDVGKLAYTEPLDCSVY